MANKRILLVGHCRPDSSYLRMTVRTALGESEIISADDNPTLYHALQQGVDLVLINRELGYGFDPQSGVEMIGVLLKEFPRLRVMLISNYSDAQAAAVAVGAVPGIGKRDLGSPRAVQALREAVGALDGAVS